MKKVVIAPQGFKESLTGMEIAEAMSIGVKRVWPEAETILRPVADGGDGTLQALVDSSGGDIRTAEVEDAIGSTIEAHWGALGNGTTAVIEVADAVGLARLEQDERDVRNASTFGIGQLFLQALDEGFTDFIIGVGGSATNDGGAGMIQAMGGKLTDKDGNLIIASSSGALGLKGAKKGTPFAAAKVGEIIGEKAEMMGVKEVNVIVKGPGAGRESAIRGFTSKNVDITGIRDVTPVPFNGPTKRKPSRV